MAFEEVIEALSSLPLLFFSQKELLSGSKTLHGLLIHLNRRVPTQKKAPPLALLGAIFIFVVVKNGRRRIVRVLKLQRGLIFTKN